MPDFMTFPDARLQSRILKDHHIRRENFDPAKREHRESLDEFLKTGNWGKIQFFVEMPYATVPETVLRKMAAAGIKRMR
jgi:hypothetical protein